MTVTLIGAPAAVLAGATTLKWVAASAFTSTALLVPALTDGEPLT